MNDLMSHNDTINDLIPFNISNLFHGDEGGEERFEAIGYDFGYDFVENIAKGNRPELVRSGDIGIFGNEGKESGIDCKNDPLVVL